MIGDNEIGPRTQQFIMNSVRRQHVPAFQIALQVIKYWASQRCLYGKQIGYLNGSTWTFLLLKTYLLSNLDAPMTAETLISAFFNTWSKWDWRHPVMLTKTIPTLGNKSPDYQTMVKLICKRIHNVDCNPKSVARRTFKMHICRLCPRVIRYAVQHPLSQSQRDR